MISVGIDPGIHGGIVALNAHRDIIFIDIMPKNISEFHEILLQIKDKKTPTMVFLEKGQSMPGNGAVAMFNYGFHNGELSATIKFTGLPFEMVPPNVWCKQIHAGCSGHHPKDKSRQAVQRLFPGIDLTNPHNTKARTIHEGIMDALLIAEYGHRKMKDWGKKNDEVLKESKQ